MLDELQEDVTIELPLNETKKYDENVAVSANKDILLF